MKRKPHRDPVPLAVHDEVLHRDNYRCVAPVVDPAAGECRTAFGGPMEGAWGGYRVNSLQLDHVKDQPRMGRRAESDRDHLVSLCPWHHLEGWATSHRPELREYLRLKADPISSPDLGTPTEALVPVPSDLLEEGARR